MTSTTSKKKLIVKIALTVVACAFAILMALVFDADSSHHILMRVFAGLTAGIFLAGVWIAEIERFLEWLN